MDSSFKYLQATWISPWRESTEDGAWEGCSKARKIWVQIWVPSHLGSGTLDRSLTSLSPRIWCLQEETKNSTCLRGWSQGRSVPSLQEHLHVNHEGDEETEASKVGLGVRPASRCHLLGCALRQVISHLSLSYIIGEMALLLLEGLLPFSVDARQTDSTYKRPSQEFTK